MRHFLENHDERRIASPEFVGNAEKGKPAMVVSVTISTSPTMIYFGQEVGEPRADNAGFGEPSRTSIFDYIGVPHHQRWVNNKKFDGGQLSQEEKELRDFYKRLLNFTISSSALMVGYQEIHFYNKENTENYNHKVLSYVRWSTDEKLIVISNFDADEGYSFELKLPNTIISEWQLKDGSYDLIEKLYGEKNKELKVVNGQGLVLVKLKPLESFIFKMNN